MHFSPKDISPQIIYYLNNHPYPCHIRDKASRYLYMNPGMSELLNVPTGVTIEGKGLSEIKPDISEFFEGLHQQEEKVIQQKTSVSLLITSHFGKENSLQPYIFDIHPFCNQEGELIGTIAEARQCHFFSPLDYIQGKSPTTLTTSFPNTMLTQRELQISFYYYQGLSQKEVAECLHLSHRAVDNTLQGIYEKIGVCHEKEFKKFLEDKGLTQFILPHLLASNIRVID